MMIRQPRLQFTVEMYLGLYEIGVIEESSHVELLNGEIIEKTQIGPMHAFINAQLGDFVHDQLILHPR